MRWKSVLAVSCALMLTLVFSNSAQAQESDEWKFGIGGGLSSFSMDGDIGFPGSSGGTIFDVDLSNSDTQDLVESGFGVAGFAAKGKWRIQYALGRLTLEDESGGAEAEWDRDKFEVLGIYNFAKTGRHSWGALFGARYMGHDWSFKTSSSSFEIDETWTDAIVGMTHAFPFADMKWSWTNQLDLGFGDSEGSAQLITALNWHFGERWTLNFNLRASSIEFGDEDDIDKSDFYLYDVDETAFGVGILFTW